jgi:uncharacterized membrane protein
MTERFIGFGEDLPTWVGIAAGVVCLLSALYQLAEWRFLRRGARSVLAFGMVANVLVLLAILRPVWVSATRTTLGARVVLILDRSRRLTLHDGAETRQARLERASKALLHRFGSGNVDIVEFGGHDRPSTRGSVSVPALLDGQLPSRPEDLRSALSSLPRRVAQVPSMVVVLSDGRWSHPASDAPPEAFRLPSEFEGTPLYAVDVSEGSIPDASIRQVRSTTSAVAHQPFSLQIEVGCGGGLSCGRIAVVVREYRKGSDPAVLGRVEAVLDGRSEVVVEPSTTLERAGTRMVEIEIEAPNGDRVPQNNKRIIAFNVVRDRLRLLHVAGRPTYDVRALRGWMKSDASVDLVSFFILRTDEDEPNTTSDAELALIPFPVDELFTEHLASFDAVVLEDIDAVRYRLTPYLENISHYVEQGGGLLLVGGTAAFAGGGYERSPIERVLPISLLPSDRPYDSVEFVPRVTEAGKSAALLMPLTDLLGERLPSFSGANTFGPARPDAVVLWEHPGRTALPFRSSQPPGPMPVLAVSEVRDGRVVALSVDSTFRFGWGEVGAATGGRAYGAFWDGLLGWVMREPRFEGLRSELLSPCIVGTDTTLRIMSAGNEGRTLKVRVERLARLGPVVFEKSAPIESWGGTELPLSGLDEGAYSVVARIGEGPGSRMDFACEHGGEEYMDSRPDRERLRRLAEANQGKVVDLPHLAALPTPRPSEAFASRTIKPILPQWSWAFFAALALAVYYILRRQSGLG